MYGNISILDTLKNANQTVAAFGEEAAFEVLSEVLSAHNVLMNEMLDLFVEKTNERLFISGTVDTMEMRRVDESGAVDVQKVGDTQNLGLPLYLNQIAVGWTRKGFQQMSTARLAAQFVAANDADVRGIYRDVQLALFTPTNNLNYKDRLVDNVKLELRALLNGDGFEAPYGPGGVAFPSNHTHYTASATLTEAAALATINNVVEHGLSGEVLYFVSQADEATVRGFANFKPYVDNRINQPTTSEYATGRNLDMVNVTNRAIGILGAAEVWVKPWIRASYQAAVDLGGSSKPLGLRTRSGDFTTGPGALTIAADHEHYPLRAQWMEREYGLGVINRFKAAAHYSGGATYVVPIPV